MSDKDGKDILERIHDRLLSADAMAWGRYGQFHPFRLAVSDAVYLVSQKLGEFRCHRFVEPAGREKQPDNRSGSTPRDIGTP